MREFPEVKNFNVKDNNGVVVVEIDCEDSSGNAFSMAVLDELNAILDTLDNTVNALVFTSSKSTFVVGADVNEILEISQKGDIAELIRFVQYGQQTFNRIEDLPFVTVALINGTAMGGGLEITLACDHRVVVDDDNVKLALPETNLGILPAWGGTTRLPRLIGADNAIDLICSGRSLLPKQALKMGLVDAVVSRDKLSPEFIGFSAIDKNSIRKKKTSPLKLNMIESMMVFKGAEGMISKKAGPHYPAPLKALNVIKEARKLSRDDALELEVNAAVELSQLEVTSHLINIFLKEQRIKSKNKAFSKDAALPESITVLGAGTMGRDISYVSANKGFNTYLFDSREEAIKSAMDAAKNYLMDKVNKNFISVEEMTEVLMRIIPVYSQVDACNPNSLVIEAIHEKFEDKVNLLKRVPGQFLTSNTSTISITSLSEGTSRDVCGMHFFNPAKKMPLVEVIRGENTSEESVARVVNLALELGKTPIIVNDCPGFLVNRLLFPYLLMFDSLVGDDHNFVQIDKAMKDWGWPMGPATLCDVIGLDVILDAGKVMCEAYNWNFHENSPIKQLVENGSLGQKTGCGFYKWKEKKGKPVPAGNNYLQSKPKEISEEVVQLLMAPMTYEANKIVEENIVESWDEVDLAMITGAGFPPFRGYLSLFKKA